MVSDDKTPVNPEDEATRWTAGDARRAFGPREGQSTGVGSGQGDGSAAGQTPQAPGQPSGDAGQRAARPDIKAPAQGNASSEGNALSASQERTVEVKKPAQPSRRAASASSAASASESGRSSGSGRPATRRTRKARLRLSRIDPWSVMKTSLLFGVAGAIIFFIATWVVWGVIGASGAFDSINKAVNDLIASPTSTSKFQLSDYVNTGRVLGLTAIIGVIDAVLFTAISTLFSFLYNLAAQIMGGLELTLAED